MDPLDRDATRLIANVDQLRSTTREAMLVLPRDVLAALIRACARADLTSLDPAAQQLVGNLAIVAIFDLHEHGGQGGEPHSAS